MNMDMIQDLIRGIITSMGLYGLIPKDVAIIANANMINKMRSLDEVSTNDKFGSVATIHNGVLEGLDGKQIVPSQHVNENLNASGIYDGSVTTKTELLFVHKPSFWRGNRRKFTLETERVIRKGVTYLVATTREHWKAVYDTTTETNIGHLYNIAV